MNRKPPTILLATLVFASFATAAAAAPEPGQILEAHGFDSDAMSRIMAGEFVTQQVKPTSDRELAVAMAFFTPLPPSALVEDARKGLVTSVNPDVIVSGVIEGDGSLADFAKLTLGSDAGSQAKRYVEAKPGEDLNLSSAEIATFNKLGSGASAASVEQAIREALFARFQDYRAKGLDGIAPYARDGGSRDAGGEIAAASRAAFSMKANVPAFFAVLNQYPAAKPAKLEEFFDWSRYMAHGEPVSLLTHRMFLVDGDVVAMAQRQYYVSGSYNVEQAVGGILPVKGGSIVFYLNRTSTDQVTGFGGSAKRSIGSKLMASQIEDLYKKARAAAEK